VDFRDGDFLFNGRSVEEATTPLTPQGGEDVRAKGLSGEEAEDAEFREV
jgi:hypothetical protein